EATRGGRHGAHFTDPPACSLARTQSEGAGRGTGPSGFDHRGDQGVPREEVSWERPGNKAATVMPAVMPKPTPFRDNWRRPARRAKENRPGNIGFPGRPVMGAAKCVAKQSDELFERVHHALYEAFFTESRNIAEAKEVAAIVAAAGADMERFTADFEAGIGRDAVIGDYEAAVSEHGVR